MDLTSTIIDQVGQFILPFVRISSMLMVSIVIGTKLVPIRVRILISLAITFCIYRVIPQHQPIELTSLFLFPLIAHEVLIGLSIGFATLLITQPFMMGGELFALQAGLGFSSMVDPMNGINVPAVSQVYLMMVSLIYLSMNGHLIMIEVITDSFEYMPVAASRMPQVSLWSLVEFARWTFIHACSLALPAIVALMITNFALGIMNKAAPQLNVMTIGFSMTLAIGFTLMIISLPTVLSKFTQVFEQVLTLSRTMIMARN